MQDWKTKTDFYDGYIKIGGKNCGLIQVYAYLMIIPVVINLIFNLNIFITDIKDSKTTLFELPILLIFLYPQWRCIKILYKYCKNKNEDELQQELEENDRDVSFIEPFIEAPFQV